LLRLTIVCGLLAFSAPLAAQVVVFSQPGFPTIDSQPVDPAAIQAALGDSQMRFVNLEELKLPEMLRGAQLFVLPYGSAVPVDAWGAIESYVGEGGNLLLLGGQPLRVPVTCKEGRCTAGPPQDTYARTLDLRHSYEVPVPEDTRFVGREGLSDARPPQVRASRFFAEEGKWNGFGYMQDRTGTLVAAPLIFTDRPGDGTGHGSRIVALDFDPGPGYWQSPDGVALIRQAGAYALEGAEQLRVEVRFSTIRPGEVPQVTLHLSRSGRPVPESERSGEAQIEVRYGSIVEESLTLPLNRNGGDLEVPFRKALAPGFYTITARYSSGGRLQDAYQTGLWVAESEALDHGPVLGTNGDFLSLDHKPFLPVGTNYFTTEENGWDFSSARNAWVWEKDFAEMEAHNVTFVRTGVWMPNARFLEGATGGVNERFLRNLEAYLLCAQRHHIAVNFTFFAFSPQSGPSADVMKGGNAPPPNPYIDPSAVRAQQAYVRSIVARFKSVPWLSWDLINEPSFSNPRQIFHGNVPNGDASELVAWRGWLQQRYGTLRALAQAWSVTPEQLGSFDAIPLPALADLAYERSGNPRQVRALDYNLFAQETFAGWVKTMVATIRETGSTQLIDVGQDEGGVTDRLLNQFYAGAGVSFTTNHTYWQDDALLWDSVAAKRVGMPNIIGETGYQPAWAPDGSWRYDEFTGLGLIERKWALGFAGGSSGVLQWDWAREVDFGMQRSDGSAKQWETMLAGVGGFARQAAPYATGLVKPEIALVLPQSYQLSVQNRLAVKAQQNAVRALYQQARAEAYVVGEYQIEDLGSPKLILLPSPFGLSEHAWQTILDRVRQGSTLLVTGPFDGDPHLRPTGRQDAVGIPYDDVPLTLREEHMHWPGGDDTFTFPGNTTTTLSQAQVPSGGDWVERPLGGGRILFAALPLELSDSLGALGRIYRYAIERAAVTPTYTTNLADTGILICPTKLPQATLYVITSESNQTQVLFRDARSGKTFSETLSPGRASLLLVGTGGEVLARYHWTGQ
jgi:Beta-galactosidase